MAAILQLRQGSTSTYITQGPNIAEPFFDTGSNILVVGKSSTEVIKLTKLDESNAGSFSITGDYTGSNLYLSGDISASNANLSGDITIGGNIILGDQIQDIITVSGQFDSDLIPSSSEQYNLGSVTKKWNTLYALSASIDSIDLVSNLPSGVVSSSTQIDTGSTHFQEGVELYSINSVTNASGIYVLGGNTVGVQIRGLSADGLDFDGPGNLIIDTGSDHFIGGAQAASLSGLPSGVISGSSQISSLGYDGYGGWNIHDGSNMEFIGSSHTLYLVNGGGLVVETDSPTFATVYTTLTLDTGSTHFTNAVAAVGAPAGTVSGSQQVIDLLPTGVVSGSEQLPSGLISGSSQILDGSGILSSSLHPNGFDSYTYDVSDRFELLETSSNALNAVSHSHANKANLDTIDQDLSTTDNVEFNQLNASYIESSGNLRISGTGSFESNLTIYGDLTVFGTESIVNSENLSIADNMIYLNSGSTITNPDLGWAGNYNDGGYAHAGIFRDASDGIFKFYDSYTPEPEGSIDTSHGSFTLAPIQVQSVNATLVTAENFVGTGSQLVFDGTNIVSSSQQVVDFLPSGLVSGSSQVITILNDNTVISGSSQLENIFFSQLYAPEIIGTDVSDVWNSALNRLATTYAIQKFISDEGVISGSSQISLLDPFTQLDPSYVLLSTETYEEADNRLASTLAISKELNSKGIVSGSSQIQSLLPAGTVSSSVQIIEILETQTPGLVSGSDQVTQSLDLRYVTSGGSGILSSSNENFSDFSQSVDIRLLDTLSSGSATSQSLYTLVGNFPTSGSLGTSAFYNVSSSLADDPNVIPNVKAVYDYINNVVQAADITGVSASLGLFGGGFEGYVSLSLDTASAHFSDGVQNVLPSGVISGSGQISFPSSDNYGGWYVDGDNTNPIYVASNRTVDFEGRNGIITEARNPGNFYISIDLDTGSAHFTDAVSAVGTPQGTISSSAQITSFGFISASTSLYNDEYNLAIGTSTPTNLGATQFTINDSNTAGISGLVSFTDSNVVKSYDYVLNNYRYIDTNSGVGIVLKPDSDGTKSWIVDTDGDLVSNGGQWTSGNIYANNLIASSSVTASNMLVDNDIIANNFIGTIQSDNGVVSSSQQITDFGFISESNSLYIDANDFSFGGTPQNAFGLNQITIRDDNAGYSGMLAFQDNTTLKSFDYVASNYRYIDTNTGVGIVLKPDADGTKSWIVDTDGDLVSNGGSWASGNAYMNNLIASSSVTASNMLVDNDITANNFIGTIKADNGVISGSSQIVELLPSGVISGSEQLPQGLISGSSQILEGSNVVSSSQQISDYNVFLEINGMGVISGSDQLTGSLVTLNTDQTISGTKTFQDIVVNGTGSFAYFVSAQTSVQYIGDSFIVLNNDTPTERYAGLAVYDSGSTNTTASLQFDGQTNDWFYEYSDDGGLTTDHGVVLFGPEYSTKGSPTYLTNNKVLKGTGTHHLADSNITDNGTTITLGSNTNVSGILTATTFKGMISGSSQVTIGGDATGSADDINVIAINGVTITNAEATQLANIDSVTISNAQWGYLGGLTATNTELNQLDGVTVGGTAAGDIVTTNGTQTLSNKTISAAQVTEISNLTAAEGAQLENIGTTTISATQWGYLGASNQGIATTDDVTFNTVSATGDIVAYASSDRRLKDEITQISNPLQKINQIGGYSFVWNSEKQNIYKGKDYGVIAQEIEEILPELVDTRESGYKAVKYDRLVSLLIEGIKELSQEVKELKEKINRE